MKNIICGYASAFGNPIVIGYVASTAAANPLGIIEFVTALSSRENLFVRVIFATNILPKKTAIVIKIPNITYSIWPKLPSILQIQRRKILPKMLIDYV